MKNNKNKFKDFPYLKRIMKEMCKRVGADFNKMNFKKQDWFLEYSWTKENEEKFKKWLMNFLYKNRKAREEILEFPSKNKNKLKNAINMFLFSYGWKLKE